MSVKDVLRPKSKMYQASIDYISTAANFNFELWNKNKPKDDAPFAMGKQILQQVQVILQK